MGAPVGNQNAAKSRLVEQTLRRIAMADDGAKLRSGLEKVMELFNQGDPWAVQFVADRLDGRPAQQIIATDNEGRGLTVVLASLTASIEHSVQSGSESLPALPLPAKAVPEEAPPIPGEWH